MNLHSNSTVLANMYQRLPVRIRYRFEQVFWVQRRVLMLVFRRVNSIGQISSKLILLVLRCQVQKSAVMPTGSRAHNTMNDDFMRSMQPGFYHPGPEEQSPHKM